MSRRAERIALGIILALALLLRIGTAAALQQHISQTPGRLCLIAGDAEGYWELARKISAGEDYSIHNPPRYVLRMPGFPALLAIGIKLFGIGEDPTFLQMFLIRCELALIGTAVCAFVFLLGRELFDSKVGLIAAAISAFSPMMIGFSVLILAETPFALGILFTLWTLARLHRARGSSSEVRHALIAGAAIALTTYMRPTWIIVAPLWIFISWLFADRWMKVIRQAFWLHLGLLVILSPWIVRNDYVTGHFVATTLWSGPSLYDGLHPQATGESDMTFLDRDGIYHRMNEYDADRHYSRLAWDYLKDNPRHALQLAVIKAARYWSLWPNANQFQDLRLRWIVFFSTFPPLLLAMIGTRKLLRKTGSLQHPLFISALLWGPILLFSAIHLLYVGSLRYRLPAEYPLFVLSGFGIREMMRRFGWFMDEPASEDRAEADRTTANQP